METKSSFRRRGGGEAREDEGAPAYLVLIPSSATSNSRDMFSAKAQQETTERLDSCENSKAASFKISSCPCDKWPCANCHAAVKATDSRCPACHGIQVRILNSAEIVTNQENRWMARVASPALPPRPSPLALIQDDAAQQVSEERDDAQQEQRIEKTLPNVVYDDDEDNDEGDELLEISVATPEHLTEEDDDDLGRRPTNPVASLLLDNDEIAEASEELLRYEEGDKAAKRELAVDPVERTSKRRKRTPAPGEV